MPSPEEILAGRQPKYYIHYKTRFDDNITVAVFEDDEDVRGLVVRFGDQFDQLNREWVFPKHIVQERAAVGEYLISNDPDDHV